MRLRVTDQCIQNPGDDAVALALGYCDKEPVEDVDQLLMLVVDGLDVDTVVRRPLEEDFVVSLRPETLRPYLSVRLPS